MYKKAFSFVLLAVLCLAGAAQSISPFQPGERVVFVGNSITEAGYYESYIWLYYMLHYPGRRITVYNAGIGGDQAKNIVARLDDDVFAKKPTTIALTFGMNDTGYWQFLQANADSTARQRIQECHDYFDQIAKRLVDQPARKIMISSSSYDETVKNPKNYFPGKSIAMDSVAAFQQRAAVAHHWGFVDFLHPMTAITLREQRKDSAFTLTGSDRIHPGNAGHFVMAYLFLKNQGMSGKPVADVRIDAAAGKVVKSENCQLSDVKATRDAVRMDYLANSLPFPQDSVPRLWENPHRQTEALSVIPFNEEMNREMLTVRGLGAGTFTLSIDGRPIGKWSRDELAAGINLALQKNTPQYEQAMSVLWLNEERMALESKLRAYYWLQFDYFRDAGLLYADNAAAMDSVIAKAQKDWAVASKKDNYRAARYPAVRAAWQKEMDVLVDEIYKINQPRKHTIVIRRDSAVYIETATGKKYTVNYIDSISKEGVKSYPDSIKEIGGISFYYIRFFDLRELRDETSTVYKKNMGRNIYTSSSPFAAYPQLNRDSLNGKVCLLHFWATTCGPCVRSLGEFDTVFKDYLIHRQIEIFNFSEENDTLVKKFLSKYSSRHFPGLFIPSADSLFSQLAITGLPTLFIVDRTGVITNVFLGQGGKIDKIKDAVRKDLQ